MRFKLDENCDPRWKVPLVLAGHEAATAAEESLQGAEDEVLAERIREEGVCLITAEVQQLVVAVSKESPVGRLWIVEPCRLQKFFGNGTGALAALDPLVVKMYICPLV